MTTTREASDNMQQAINEWTWRLGAAYRAAERGEHRAAQEQVRLAQEAFSRATGHLLEIERLNARAPVEDTAIIASIHTADLRPPCDTELSL